MQHLGMSRISHAQEDPGLRTVPRIDLSPTPRSETVLPMLQRRPGGFDNNEVLEAYPSLFKPSGTDSMLLGSSPAFLLRSPVFLRAARLQFARNHVRWNRQQWRTVTFSDESRFCLRHIDGRLRVWRRNGERHTEVNVQPRHAYNGGSVMVWAGVTADRRTDLVVVPGILPDNATSTRSYVLMWCLSYAQWATMASSKMTTQGCIRQELSTDFCKLTM